jgi:ureidoglycolate lyase
LTAKSFAPYGEVIELSTRGTQRSINDGSCVRHHDLARPVAVAPGVVGLSLFDAAAVPVPAPLHVLERHRLGSQAFAPFGASLRMLVVVADARLDANALRPEHLAAFVTSGQQGIQLRIGTWHHPLLSLQAGPWLVADRIAEAGDCETLTIRPWQMHCGLGTDA